MRQYNYILSFLLCAIARGSDAPAHSPPWPLWDGNESVEEYARRANLPPARTLDLGNGVKLELVLIPAGKFIMGTPEPEPVDTGKFQRQIITGQALLAAGVGVLLVSLVVVIVQARRKKRRPNFSLRRWLAMTAVAGIALLGGLHWWHSVKTLAKAKAEYVAEQVRYAGASNDLKPAHLVTLTQPFYMGTFAVTQEQYQQIMRENFSRFKGKDNPVECVTWDDAQEFCKRVTEQMKSGGAGVAARRTIASAVRLPTEAEWEYACRAGTTTTYYSGDAEQDLDRVAWYNNNSNGSTHPVGQKDSNIFGLYDMHGNVFQWCQDWFEGDYHGKSPAEDPGGPTKGTYRVLRGGCWGHSRFDCRSPRRAADIPDARYGTCGFRVVVVGAPSRTP